MENVPQVDIQAILRKGSAFKLIMDLVEHIVSLANNLRNIIFYHLRGKQIGYQTYWQKRHTDVVPQEKYCKKFP